RLSRRNQKIINFVRIRGKQKCHASLMIGIGTRGIGSRGSTLLGTFPRPLCVLAGAAPERLFTAWGAGLAPSCEAPLSVSARDGYPSPSSPRMFGQFALYCVMEASIN